MSILSCEAPSMSYTFEDFLAKKPSETYLSRFQEGGIERGVFSACWDPESFDNLLEFQIFLFRYSALMQPCIHEYGHEELKTYLKPDEGADRAARAFHSEHQEVSMDAKVWCSQKLNFADFSWLDSGEYTTLMEFEIDGQPEMIAHGPAGFLSIFVADTMV